ncbi:hypothetical protein MTO96_000075 [Rhipicephalus appendiculatus]
MPPGNPLTATQRRLKQGNDAGDRPPLPAQPLQPAQVSNINFLSTDRRRTFIVVGLCAGVLFVVIVAYVSVMKTVKLAALTQAKHDVTVASTSDRHREGSHHRHTGKNTAPTPHLTSPHLTKERPAGC